MMEAKYRPKPRAEIYRNMSAIRASGNKTDTALRRALFAKGYRFRKNVKGILGRPDIAFPRERIAIFVDGDFWHARVLREEGLTALESSLRTADKQYWISKFERRVVRDDHVTAALRSEGWTVLRFWEADIEDNISGAIEVIVAAIRDRRER